MFKVNNEDTKTMQNIPCAGVSIVNFEQVSFLSNFPFSGIDQLLSQGTADLILNLCTDVWNGEEITELKDNERFSFEKKKKTCSKDIINTINK